jgi:hypothetical protein
VKYGLNVKTIGFLDFVRRLVFKKKKKEHDVSETGYIPVLRLKGGKGLTQMTRFERATLIGVQ